MSRTPSSIQPSYPPPGEPCTHGSPQWAAAGVNGVAMGRGRLTIQARAPADRARRRLTGRDTMAERDDGHQAPAPVSWQDWQRWAEEADWTDWRSWLRRVASTDWASAPWPSAPWDQAGAAPEGGISLSLRSLEEDELGEHLTAAWPAFRRWWREGANDRPTAWQAGARLDEHMPELVPAWRRMTEILGDDPEAAAA